MNERSEKIAGRFEIPLLLGAALAIPVVLVEQSTVGQPWRDLTIALDWAIWVAFLAEVVMMLAVVPDRGRWLREHPLDVAIVILTPPFLSAILQGARVLRLLRLLRLVRLAQLGRQVFSPTGLQFAAVAALMTVLAGGAVFAEIEHRSAWDGIWWCVTTMTTLGSDIQPTTTGGRILAIVAVLVGVSFVALLTGAVARRFLSEDIAEIEEEIAGEFERGEEDIIAQVRDITERLQRLEKDLAARHRRDG